MLALAWGFSTGLSTAGICLPDTGITGLITLTLTLTAMAGNWTPWFLVPLIFLVFTPWLIVLDYPHRLAVLENTRNIF
ncbi:MAG: hypothetical protein JXA13_00785 [Anaerolineales bacterium]|nr:hypothetical protein [Anaerolineales bacterium]